MNPIGLHFPGIILHHAQRNLETLNGERPVISFHDLQIGCIMIIPFATRENLERSDKQKKEYEQGDLGFHFFSLPVNSLECGN
jgi:hypothetical protein